MYRLYQITNTINGKSYVGITKLSIENRWATHLSCSRNPKYPLHHAIAKHGECNFTIAILEENIDREYIGRMEEVTIQLLDSHVSKHGYNVAKGGYGGDLGPAANTKRNETIRGMSFEQKLIWKNRLSEARKGKHHSLETLEKMSSNQLLRGGYGPETHSVATRTKISTSNSGKVRSEQARQNYSKCAKLRGTGPQLQGKRIGCLCCKREWDLGNYTQHISRKQNELQ